jgi:hypothetical protein
MVTFRLMSHRYPVESLTPSEAARAQEIAKKHGVTVAAQKLGVHVGTLRKAMLQEPVHQLTAAVLRAKLPDTL